MCEHILRGHMKINGCKLFALIAIACDKLIYNSLTLSTQQYITKVHATE